MTSENTANDIEPTNDSAITRGKFGWDGSSGICAGEMMRASGCWFSRRATASVYCLSMILVEVLVRLEPLRHLSDRRFGLIKLEHLLPRGLKLLTQRRLVHFGTFHLIA